MAVAKYEVAWRIMMPRNLSDEIDRLAEATDRTRSAFVRRAVTEYLEREKTGGTTALDKLREQFPDA